GHIVSAVLARCRASALPRRDEATAGQPQETFGVPRSPRYGGIAQDTPGREQTARSAEQSKARRQDLRPAASLLLSPQHCMQTEPRAASMSRGLLVCCCHAVGRHFSEEVPVESLAPYHSIPPLL